MVGRRDIGQAEGVEQGDPLAPGFYALGQHDSLVAASAFLRPGGRPVCRRCAGTRGAAPAGRHRRS